MYAIRSYYGAWLRISSSLRSLPGKVKKMNRDRTSQSSNHIRAPGFARGKIKGVITSYSIHYTKLYEHVTAKVDHVKTGCSHHGLDKVLTYVVYVSFNGTDDNIPGGGGSVYFDVRGKDVHSGIHCICCEQKAGDKGFRDRRLDGVGNSVGSGSQTGGSRVDLHW